MVSWIRTIEQTLTIALQAFEPEDLSGSWATAACTFAGNPLLAAFNVGNHLSHASPIRGHTRR
jgi:hypothetical protein